MNKRYKQLKNDNKLLRNHFLHEAHFRAKGDKERVITGIVLRTFEMPLDVHVSTGNDLIEDPF